MDDLKKYTNEEIVKLIQEKKISVADLTDSGICPTCFNKENNNVLFGDDKEKTLYVKTSFTALSVSGSIIFLLSAVTTIHSETAGGIPIASRARAVYALVAKTRSSTLSLVMVKFTVFIFFILFVANVVRYRFLKVAVLTLYCVRNVLYTMPRKVSMSR